MSEVVLDASALLAWLNQETGTDQVAGALDADDAVYISAVNVAEVTSKLAELGVQPEEIERAMSGLDVVVVPFAFADALDVGLLRVMTRQAGLSPGDRACIALATRLRLPVLTADRAWASLGLAVEVVLIR